MEPTYRNRLARTATALLLVAGLATGLCACRPDGATLAAAGSASSVTAATASSAASTPTAGAVTATAASSAASTPTAGSITASITAPVSVSGTVATAVSCVTSRATYRASVSSAIVDGDQLTFAVSIAGYRDPGSYPAIVSVTLRQSTGTVTSLAGVAKVPALVTSAGGSFTVTATSSEGRTFTGSLAWVCGQ